MSSVPMSANSKIYDVAIIGASIGGCATAILFAQQGLRVALIERNSDINAYKKVCTHFIQPTATPTIKRLGLAEAIEEAGGVRNRIDVWTRWGWVPLGTDDSFYGYNIRRQVLDPLLRHQAASTPGVDFLPGTTLRELIYRGDRIAGIRAAGRDRQNVDIQAQLVIGADGRYSRTAELAGRAALVQPNNRFMYFTYYRNLSLTSGRRSQHWLLDPNIAYAMPNDNGITLVALMLPKRELAAFKRDVQGNFVRFFDTLPDGPNLREAEQVSKVMGMLNIPCISRTTTAPGLALVGDAALATDPLWGVGCGWAFQSAEWLVEATAEALNSGCESNVDQALEQYRHKHQAVLGSRHARLADFATVRPFNFLERLMYGAAAQDPRLARYTGPYQSGLSGLRQRPPFKMLARALWLNLTRRDQQRPNSGTEPSKVCDEDQATVYKRQAV